MKAILQLLLTALSLIARPRFHFICCADHHVFPLSHSKLEIEEKRCYCKKIKCVPDHAYGSADQAFIPVLLWSRLDSQLTIIFLVLGRRKTDNIGVKWMWSLEYNMEEGP